MNKNHFQIRENIRIRLNNAEFACRVLGNGPKKIIAFHGFGQDGLAFASLLIHNPDFTVYSFDLPFHGQTKVWDYSKCLSKEEIVELISKLISLENIDRFSLLGFSIGAKLVFPVLEVYFEKTDHVWLLAPEGVKSNIWYRFATSTSLMRRILQSALHFPNILSSSARVLSKLGIVHKGTAKTVMFILKSPAKSAILAECWIYLRKLQINTKEFAEKINHTKPEIFILLGENDNIISKKAFDDFCKALKRSQCIILPCGHENLIRHFTDWLASKRS